jgi:hypothetical protein
MPILFWTLMLLERRPTAQLSASFDGDRNAASAGVVSRKDMFASCIDDQVARRGPLRRLRVKESQVARLVIDRKGTDGRVGFIDGI